MAAGVDFTCFVDIHVSTACLDNPDPRLCLPAGFPVERSFAFFPVLPRPGFLLANTVILCQPGKVKTKNVCMKETFHAGPWTDCCICVMMGPEIKQRTGGMDSKERLIVLLRYQKDNTDRRRRFPRPDIRRMFGDLGEVFPRRPSGTISRPTWAKEDIVVREVSGKGTFFKYLGREWSEAELWSVDAISASGLFQGTERLADRQDPDIRLGLSCGKASGPAS